MFKKYSALILIISAIHIFVQFSAFAQTQNDKDLRLVLNVKNTIARVGTEPNRKLKVRLRDGTKLKGYITEIKDDHFALLDTKSGKVVSVEYSQVSEARRDGLSRFATALIATSVVFGGLMTLGLIAARSED